MTKHYVTLAYPGTFVSEMESKEIPVRDAAALDIPTNCYGYQFYDIEEIVVDGETLRGNPKNQSPWHYFGRKMSLEDVAEKYGKGSILYDNMRINGWSHVVDVRTGQTFNLNNGDIVLEDEK